MVTCVSTPDVLLYFCFLSFFVAQACHKEHLNSHPPKGFVCKFLGRQCRERLELFFGQKVHFFYFPWSLIFLKEARVIWLLVQQKCPLCCVRQYCAWPCSKNH